MAISLKNHEDRIKALENRNIITVAYSKQRDGIISVGQVIKLNGDLKRDYDFITTEYCYNVSDHQYYKPKTVMTRYLNREIYDIELGTWVYDLCDGFVVEPSHDGESIKVIKLPDPNVDGIVGIYLLKL